MGLINRMQCIYTWKDELRYQLQVHPFIRRVRDHKTCREELLTEIASTQFLTRTRRRTQSRAGARCRKGNIARHCDTRLVRRTTWSRG